MKEEELLQKIQDIVRSQVQSMDVRPMSGTVMKGSVDEKKRICKVKPDDGPPVTVNLQSITGIEKGEIIIPEEGSTVIIGFHDEDRAYICLAAEVKKKFLDLEQYVINGGDNEGLVIVGKLVDRLNALEDAQNNLVQRYNSHQHPDPSSGSTGTTSLPSSDTVAKTKQKDIENKDVKH
jgi:hypothetical protein